MRSQAAVEQDDGKRQIGDEERQRHVVEIDLTGAVLAGQHAYHEKNEQQRRAETRQ